MNKKTLATLLTFSGAIPFLAAIILHWQNISLFGLNPQIIVFTYAAVIVSFISGIHWGTYLFKDTPLNLFIHSNIITLAAWAAAIIAKPISIVIAYFAYLLFIDIQLHKQGILGKWFLQMRVWISFIVVTFLIFQDVFKK